MYDGSQMVSQLSKGIPGQTPVRLTPDNSDLLIVGVLIRRQPVEKLALHGY